MRVPRWAWLACRQTCRWRSTRSCMCGERGEGSTMGVGLKDRTALVLGGSRGLGLGVAAALADRGASVTLVGRDEAALQAASAQISGNGGEVATISADLASEAGMQLLLSRL